MRRVVVLDASVAIDIGAGVFLSVVLVVAVVIASLLVRGTVRGGLGEMDTVRRRRLAGRRVGRARGALAEAALDKDYFELDEIELRVRELLRVAARIWQAAGRGTPSAGESVIADWARSVIDIEGSGAHIVGRERVDVLGVVNRAGESEDRVILRVRFGARQPPGETGAVHTWTADMRWTLGRRHGRWVLLSIDGDPLSDGVLRRRLIPARWADEDRLREESLHELAGADALAPGTDFSALVDPDQPPERQLRELAQLDGRFDVDLLAAALGHLLEAWEESCTGSPAPLFALATKETVAPLLHPSLGESRCRLMLRDAALESWSATRLSLAPGQTPRVSVELVLGAVCFLVEDPGGEIVGSREARERMTLSWTLELTGSSTAAWRLCETSDPARQFEGW